MAMLAGLMYGRMEASATPVAVDKASMLASISAVKFTPVVVEPLLAIANRAAAAALACAAARFAAAAEEIASRIGMKITCMSTSIVVWLLLDCRAREWDLGASLVH